MPYERRPLERWPKAEVELFRAVLAFVLAVEGGLSNHPLDGGGLTMQGVTQNVYDRYRLRHGRPLRSVRYLDEDERDRIYWDDFWTLAQCGELPAEVAAVHFDTAVNSGPKRAAKLLQATLNVRADGVIGPVTLAALGRYDPQDVARRYLDTRRAYYRRLVELVPQKYGPFLRGWLARVDKLEREVLV